MPRAEPISTADYRRLAEFRYVLRCFLRFSEEAAEKERLTPQQHQALLALKGFQVDGALSVGELAERLQLRHHSAVGLVDRMVALRLVRRERSSKDRRQVQVRLAPRGEQVLARLAVVHRAQLRRLSPRLKEVLEAFAG